MTPPPGPRPGRREAGPQTSSSPRVVVVGGGVIGLSCAYALAVAGARVTLLERGEIGGGTSSRCDGNVLLVDKDPGFDGRMTLLSQKLLADLAQRLGPMEYRAPGSYLVCDSQEEAEAAHEWVARHRAEGMPLDYLTAGDVRRLLPHVSPHVPAGVYCHSDSTLNPLLYTHQLARACLDEGAQLRTHCGVRGVEVRGGRVVGVRLGDPESDDGVAVAGGAAGAVVGGAARGGAGVGAGDAGELVEADAVVLATGVWTPWVLAGLGLEMPVKPRKGTLLVAARGRLFGHEKVMEFGYLMTKFGRKRVAPADALEHGVALVYEPTASGNFLLGSSREFAGFDDQPQVEVVRAIARRAVHFYPGMRSVSVIRAYSGLRPWTPDHLPTVGFVPEVPGLLVAAGHEGDGIGLAAVTGALARDLVLERQPPFDPRPLRWGRWAEGDAA